MVENPEWFGNLNIGKDLEKLWFPCKQFIYTSSFFLPPISMLVCRRVFYRNFEHWVEPSNIVDIEQWLFIINLIGWYKLAWYIEIVSVNWECRCIKAKQHHWWNDSWRVSNTVHLDVLRFESKSPNLWPFLVRSLSFIKHWILEFSCNSSMSQVSTTWRFFELKIWTRWCPKR